MKVKWSKRSESSIVNFGSCWLVAVLFFFTFSATKLPSYWLPATPAASLIVGLSAFNSKIDRKLISFSWLSTIIFLILFGLIFSFSGLWLLLINDPEMPNLAIDILQTNILTKASIILFLGSFIGLISIIFNS